MNSKTRISLLVAACLFAQLDLALANSGCSEALSYLFKTEFLTTVRKELEGRPVYKDERGGESSWSCGIGACAVFSGQLAWAIRDHEGFAETPQRHPYDANVLQPENLDMETPKYTAYVVGHASSQVIQVAGSRPWVLKWLGTKEKEISGTSHYYVTEQPIFRDDFKTSDILALKLADPTFFQFIKKDCEVLKSGTKVRSILDFTKDENVQAIIKRFPKLFPRFVFDGTVKDLLEVIAFAKEKNILIPGESISDQAVLSSPEHFVAVVYGIRTKENVPEQGSRVGIGLVRDATDAIQNFSDTYGLR